ITVPLRSQKDMVIRVCINCLREVFFDSHDRNPLFSFAEPRSSNQFSGLSTAYNATFLPPWSSATEDFVPLTTTLPLTWTSPVTTVLPVTHNPVPPAVFAAQTPTPSALPVSPRTPIFSPVA